RRPMRRAEFLDALRRDLQAASVRLSPILWTPGADPIEAAFHCVVEFVAGKRFTFAELDALLEDAVAILLETPDVLTFDFIPVGVRLLVEEAGERIMGWRHTTGKQAGLGLLAKMLGELHSAGRISISQVIEGLRAF